MSPSVLISAPYFLQVYPAYQAVLEDAGIEVQLASVTEHLSAEELMDYAGEVDGVIAGDDEFSPQVLEAFAPRLRVISKWGTGIDSVDQEAANRLEIAVRNTPNAFSYPVADSVMSYILSFARATPWMDRAMKSGEWQKRRSIALRESVLGVIGVGNIGTQVLRRAAPFGMAALGNDIRTIDSAILESVAVQMVSLDELLTKSDFISLNCDLNPSSYHLINRNTLSKMKPGSVLINTARGSLIEEPALIEALQSGALAGAALDVFENEPIPQDSPLLAMENVLLAPHNANSSPEAWQAVHINTLRNLFEALGMKVPDAIEGIQVEIE